MLESKLGENTPGGHIAGAAEGRVHDLDVVSHFRNHLRVDDLLLQLCHVSVVDLFSNHLIQPLLLGLILGHGLHCMVVPDSLHFLNDLPVIGSRHLGAVLPVHLVAVILGWIVACRDHNSRRAAQGAQGKGKLGRRAQRVEHIGLDAVGSQAQSRHIRELRGHAPGVIGDGHALVLGSLSKDKVGKTLGGLADRVDVHPVGSRADNAAQSSGAELQLLVEPLLDLPLVVPDGLKLLLGVLVKIVVLQPEIILFHITHFPCPLFCAGSVSNRRAPAPRAGAGSAINHILA